MTTPTSGTPQAQPAGPNEVQWTIDGHLVSGTIGSDGSFLSDDRTIYVPPGGKPEHGISTPDDRFIQNGTTHVMPDGSTAYGQMVGKDFFAADGKTVALGGGAVLQGSIDWDTGIFTAGSGDAYFVGADGVTHGTFRPADGALVLDDGSMVESSLTPQGWAVDLAQMADALALIRSKSQLISDHNDTILQQCQNAEDAWTSPAGETFADASDNVQTVLTDLHRMVENIGDRMQQQYDNYQQAEKANVKNLSHS